MNKFLSFFGICAYILATIGGVGYALMCNAYLIAVAILVLAFMALPTLDKCRKILTEE